MFPTDFDGSNHVIDKPHELSRDECEALNVFVGKFPDGQDVIVSCWKPTMDELEEIRKTGRVWVYHWGRSLQPHYVGGKNPFEVEP